MDTRDYLKDKGFIKRDKDKGIDLYNFKFEPFSNSKLQSDFLDGGLEMEIQQSLAKHTHALEMATAKLSHSQMLEDREQQHKHKGENEDE